MSGFLMAIVRISLKCLKAMGKMYCVWPLEQKSNKYWRKMYECVWWFYFVNYLIAMSVSLITCYHGRKDFEIASFTWMEFVAFVEGFIILINYKYYHAHLQDMLYQAETFIKKADAKQILYLEKRVLPYLLMLIFITILYSTLVVLYFTDPAIASWDTLLTTAYYPPSIRSRAVDVLLYFHQIVVMFHTSVMVNLDATIVLLISICAIELQVLASKLEEVQQYEDLRNCICEHQSILCSGDKINNVIRSIASKTVLGFISYTVGAGLQLINPRARLASLERFGVVLLINCLRLILIATSAEDLSENCKNIGLTVYFSHWYQDDKKMKVTKFIMMLRCRNILKICVGGIMPALNLPYITGIISTAISYFTTLMVIAKP